jgi:hypothetical protein
MARKKTDELESSSEFEKEAEAKSSASFFVWTQSTAHLPGWGNFEEGKVYAASDLPLGARQNEPLKACDEQGSLLEKVGS